MASSRRPWGDLTKLEDLWLGGNQLTGEIPPELGNLTSLYALYLDQNQLTGEIPEELGNLAVLEDLFLYNNQLTGSIPPEVGSLEELRQLWVTNNQFTGVLPGELADLEELHTLRLSGNSFEGCVPAGLRDVATNDISRLGLEDCPAGVVGAPTGLSATLAEGTFSLTWNEVTGAGLYEAQHTTDAADADTVTWTVLQAVTGVAQTYTPAEPSPCSVAYRFRVRARGDGMTLVASWGVESPAYAPPAYAPTPNCLPAFTGAPFAFEVAEDAAVDDEVGTVSATDPDADDTVAYSITEGNDDGHFAIDGSTVRKRRRGPRWRRSTVPPRPTVLQAGRRAARRTGSGCGPTVTGRPTRRSGDRSPRKQRWPRSPAHRRSSMLPTPSRCRRVRRWMTPWGQSRPRTRTATR